MYENKTQLLCTFVEEKNLFKQIEQLKESYDIAFKKIFVLHDVDNESKFILTYNIDENTPLNPDIYNTISIHRKKISNTLYTINGLNYLVEVLSGGLDKNFQIPWEKFHNMLILISDDEIKKINTKLIKIINV